MDGTSHVGFTLAGAMTFNSLIYKVIPQPIQGEWDPVIHAAGTPWHIQDFTHLPQTITHLPPESITVFVFKLLFYLALIAWASLPDRLEKRVGELDIKAGHRGATHGLVAWILLVTVFGFAYAFFWAYCRVNHVVISAGWMTIIHAGCVLFIAILTAFLFHTLADMCTYDGVAVLWPIKQKVGLAPQFMRPRNGSLWTYLILWTFIFVVGGLFFTGFVGI